MVYRHLIAVSIIHVIFCVFACLSVELRELEGQLKSAYMNKERLAQLAEKEALKYDKVARDAEIARAMKEESERATAAERQKEVEQYEAEIRYQQELERQLEVSQ